MTEALYLAKNSPHFKVKVGQTKLQAVKGVLRCPAHLVAELDKMVLTRQDIRANLTKIDMKKAEETVIEHQRKERKQGVAGPFASNNGPEKQVQEERQRQREARGAVVDDGTGAPVEAIKEMMPPKPALDLTEMPQADKKPTGIANILSQQGGGRFGGKKS